MTFKIIELFGGIGACTAALKRLGIDVEVVDYVEIDKYAVASYNAINGTNFEPQDICEWDKDVQADLIMHGSPCQDFSIAGKQMGGDEGSGTRSSLMYETLRIVEKVRPRYVVWENVRNVLSEKHKHNVDAYINRLAMLGYDSYTQILNSKDYGIPQNRDRVFVISVKRFVFPPKQELQLRLKDMLEDEVDEKYFLSEKGVNSVVSRAKPTTMYTDIDADIAIPLMTNGHNKWQGSFVSESGNIEIQRIGNKNPSNHGTGGEVISAEGLCSTITCGDKSYKYIGIKQEVDTKPKLLGGVSDKLWGEKQYHQQDRVYSTETIAMAHPAQMSGGYLYAVKYIGIKQEEKNDE